MPLHLLAVGKLRPAYRELCDDYLRRVQRFIAVREVEVKEAGRAGTVALQQRKEGQALLEQVPEGAEVVLLELDGVGWSSETLAVRLDGWRQGHRDRALVIGGAVGVSDKVRARADLRWSLGPLTLPHELVRVLVAEQLYRAATILRGEPYHKGGR